jgi:hypothetical protein
VARGAFDLHADGAAGKAGGRVAQGVRDQLGDGDADGFGQAGAGAGGLGGPAAGDLDVAGFGAEQDALFGAGSAQSAWKWEGLGDRLVHVSPRVIRGGAPCLGDRSHLRSPGLFAAITYLCALATSRLHRAFEP